MILLLALHDPLGPLDLLDLIKEIGKLAYNLLIVITETTYTIDNIKFDEDGVITQYLGYAKNVMTAPLYTLFTSMIMASIGITIFTYFLKGTGYLKQLLPW